MPEVESQEVPDDATQPVADATSEGREAQLEDELEALLSEVLSSTSAPAGEVDMPAAEDPDAFEAYFQNGGGHKDISESILGKIYDAFFGEGEALNRITSTNSKEFDKPCGKCHLAPNLCAME
jgi:hypothetical protein